MPATDPARQLRKDLAQLGVEVSADRAAQLRMLAERKFNRYDLYSPGETFQARLLEWLTNFDRAERAVAMEIVWSLTFISHFEMRALARATFHNAEAGVVGPTRGEQSLPILLDARRQETINRLRRTLFVAVSDDVMLDYFRRYAKQQCPSLSKENFVEYYKLDRAYRSDLPQHDRVVLLDQLTASGTTALRYTDTWEGKLANFSRLWPEEASQLPVIYSPYILALAAETRLRNDLGRFQRENNFAFPIELRPTWRVPVSACLRGQDLTQVDRNAPVARLCNRYYERFPEDEHTKRGGPYTFGFGGVGLTLVLNTNCPNNTIPLVWQTAGAWKALFPRVIHHG